MEPVPCVDREEFRKKLEELLHDRKKNSVLLAPPEYFALVRAVEAGERDISTIDLRKLKSLELAIGQGVRRLRKKQTGLLVVHSDEIYDVLTSIHLSTGHGGRDYMEQEIHKVYSNISRAALMAFLNLRRPNCKQRLSLPDEPQKQQALSVSLVQQKKTSRKRQRLEEDVSRAHVEIMDWDLEMDTGHRFILLYQHLHSSFVQLKPLKQKSIPEIANLLVDIMCTFGAPQILQSGEGQVFTLELVGEISKVWRECKLVAGRGSGGGGEKWRAVESRLRLWLTLNNSAPWSQGLRFIQFHLNSSPGDDGVSPFGSCFGCEPRLGLRDSGLPRDFQRSIRTEEELLQLLDDSDDDPGPSSLVQADQQTNFFDVESSEFINAEVVVKEEF